MWQRAFYALKKKQESTKGKYDERNDSLSLCYYPGNAAPVGWLWRWVLFCAYIMIFAHWTRSFGNVSCCGGEITKRDLLLFLSLFLMICSSFLSSLNLH